MKLDIKPYEGVGLIRLGMTRAEVRKLVPGEIEPFQKGASPILDDSVVDDDSGYHVCYDKDDRCEAVEIWRGNPTLLNQPLLNQPFGEVRAWFEERDPDVQVDGDGLISKKLGVALYVEDTPIELHSPVTGILVFRRRYYEDHEAERNQP